MSFTDADLIARTVANADENAFAELVRRHQSPVRAFLARLVRGDSHLADDLAQETFLKAWRNCAAYRGESKLSTWLFGIAYNEFRNAARRRKELNWEESSQADLPAAALDPKLRLDLAEALDLLNPGERAAVVLCCQNGLSHDEAAQVLDCPLGTVKTNILRGKEKLRRRLAVAYEHYESA